MPVEIRWPLDYDAHLFAHADYLNLSSGTLHLDDFGSAAEFGKVLAYAPPFPSGAIDQSAQGNMFGVGYEAGAWRVDVGSTPTTFPVHYLVGGIRYADTLDVAWLQTVGPGAAYVSVDFARRPVTSSLLSFAGAHDPITGDVWGGVHRTGVDVYASHTVGVLNGYVGASAHRLEGEHVQANSEQRLRLGADRNFAQQADTILSAGVAVNYWRYAENEGFYTFGQGGYYSPQSYLSLSLPLEWADRYRELSWRLRGAISQSVSDDKTTPFYPVDPALQQQAVSTAQANALPSPFFGGGKGGGTGFSLGGMIEYRVAPAWAVGAQFEFDRSEFYTPNTFGLYLRYSLTPRSGSVPLPKPPQPYAYY